MFVDWSSCTIDVHAYSFPDMAAIAKCIHSSFIQLWYHLLDLPYQVSFTFVRWQSWSLFQHLHIHKSRYIYIVYFCYFDAIDSHQFTSLNWWNNIHDCTAQSIFHSFHFWFNIYSFGFGAEVAQFGRWLSWLERLPSCTQVLWRLWVQILLLSTDC